MTKLHDADVIGNTVEWTDEEGAHKAKIEYRIRDGATSSVYRAKELLEGDTSHRDWAIKVPFSAEEMESEFLDEVSLVEKLRGHYISNQLTPPLPQLKRVPFLDRTVIVIDFMRVQWQLIARCEEQEFLSTYYYAVMQQIIKLYEVLHSQGVANLDIKDENFYWLPDHRLVVLDWNRCIQDDLEHKEKSTKFNTAVLGGYRVLSNLFFQFYTGKEPPNPVPRTADSDWGLFCPRAIRRTVIDSSTAWGPNGKTISQRLLWQEKIHRSIQSGNEKALLQDCQKLHETSDIDLSERVERIQDALESLNLTSHRDNFVQELQDESDWVHYILSKSDLRLKDAIQQILKHLENYDVTLALQTCLRHLDEMSRPDQILSRTVHWKLARWSIICELFVQLSNISEINIDNYKKQIPHLLEIFGEEIINPGTEAETVTSMLSQPDVARIYGLMCTAENLKAEMSKAYGLFKAKEKLQAAIQLRQAVNELRDTTAVQFYLALEKFLPIWNIEDLEAEVLREEEFSKLEGARLKLKDQLTDILKRADQHAVLEIERIIITSEIQLGDELERVAKAIKETSQKRWRQAYEILLSKKPVTDFLTDTWAGIKHIMLKSLSDYHNCVLYEPDLAQLAEIRLLGVDISDSNLHERLSFAQMASINELDDLEKCKELMIEPWASGPDDLLLLVDQFLLKSRMQKQAKELQDLRQYINNAVSSINEVLPTQNDLDTYATNKLQAQAHLNEIRKLSQEFNEVQQEHTRLYKITQSQEELQETLQEHTKSAQEKLDALKLQEHSLRTVLDELRKVIADSENSLPFAGETNLLVQLAVGMLQKGDFQRAEKFLDQAIVAWNETEGPSAALKNPQEIVFSWKSHILRIIERPSTKDAYIHWFDSIQRNDLQSSQSSLIGLISDKGLPVYEHLLQSHILLSSGKGWGPEMRWNELFQTGKITELRMELDQLEILSSYDTWLKNQWDHRIYLYHFACQYINKANVRRAKKEMDFLHLIIPTEIWQAALSTQDPQG